MAHKRRKRTSTDASLGCFCSNVPSSNILQRGMFYSYLCFLQEMINFYILFKTCSGLFLGSLFLYFPCRISLIANFLSYDCHDTLHFWLRANVQNLICCCSFCYLTKFASNKELRWTFRRYSINQSFQEIL